ncbi:MAG: Fe-S-cluster containining protein [Arenicella sp.]|jgi:Fe-S-cluster containining protein
MDLEGILKDGAKNIAETKKLAKRLKKKKPKDLDQKVHQLHEETFNEIDCLDCGNCCKTTSPAIHDKDVDRLAKHLRVKPVDLIAQHMEMDNEGDYVFRSAPCPFLGADNYCSVYEARPLACREYPHTNRKRFYQVVELSVRNTEICPAVVRILDELKKAYS